MVDLSVYFADSVMIDNPILAKCTLASLHVIMTIFSCLGCCWSQRFTLNPHYSLLAIGLSNESTCILTMSHEDMSQKKYLQMMAQDPY
jgi:hypothetical protein